MRVSSEPAGAIDAALDQFENQWLQSGSPPDVVAAVAALQHFTGFAERRVAWEMAMCDLELRWRQPDPSLRRGCRWYADQLQSFGLSQADLEDLSAHELIVRSRWGDRPEIEALVDEQFPELQGELRRRRVRRLVEQIEAHFPVHCLVRMDNGTRFRSPVRTPCVFGRQRRCDPDPGGPQLDPESGVWRVNVTDYNQNRVSREQAIVRRVAVNCISIEPLSKNVGCYLSDRRLPKSQPVVVDIASRPRELRFHNVSVRFFTE